MDSDSDRLIAELGAALGFGPIPPDADGGYQVSLEGRSDIYLFGGSRSLTVVAPIAALPARPDYGIMLSLLRQNLFDAANGEFRLAADEAGTLVFWARLATEALTGEALLHLLRALDARVAELQGVVRGEDEEAPETAVAPPIDLPAENSMMFRL